MGLFLNPDAIQLIDDRMKVNYVDKSLLIKELNTIIKINSDKYVCVSRPRRFGKTMAANMIAAYYTKGCDSHEAFKGLKIESDPDYEEYINKYNVLKIDCGGMYARNLGNMNTVEKITELVVPEFREEFPDLCFPDCCDVATAIGIVYKAKKEKFVIIIDEYDVIIRERNEKELTPFLLFLNGLFKDSVLNSAIALSYITGILPIVKDMVQSKLNNFSEYTMLNAYSLAPFIGFTKEEVRILAENNGMDTAELERWYDGYCVDGVELYSPKSVIEAIKRGKCSDYWTATGSYEAIKKYIELDCEGIEEDVTRMMAGESVEVNINTYCNSLETFSSKDDVFTYLIHLGYLAYDSETKTCRIPNNEIKNQWGDTLRVSKKYKKQSSVMVLSKELLNATIALDSDAVASALDRNHEIVTSNLSYNNEQSLQSAIILAYFYAYDYYTVITEMGTGKGYADVVMIPFVPDKPALVIELKKDQSEGKAIAQIKKKHYHSGLERYVGNTLLVGVNYDSKTKKHTAVIEKA
ncbi:MAG: AAA family ATPase [Candidatus Ornithospirochaeta sp.]